MEPRDEDQHGQPAKQQVAQRRIVLHPRTASARRLDRTRASGSSVRGHAVDTPEVLEYVRAQRRLGLQIFVPVITTLLLLLAASALFDGLGRAQVGDVPLLWLLLGPVSLFSILGLAVFNERRALRLEDQWTEDRR